MTASIFLSFSIFFFVTGIFYLTRGKKIFFRILIPLVSFILSFLLGIAGISIQGYKNLLKEEIIARVRAERYEDFGLLYVKFAEEEGENIYILKEEKWGVSANFLKWKKWLNFIGLKPVYKLKEIGGYPFYESFLSKWMWAHLLKRGYLYPFVDIVFESAVYSEVFGKEVLVKATSSGLTLSTK
jgi:hypothetical protein